MFFLLTFLNISNKYCHNITIILNKHPHKFYETGIKRGKKKLTTKQGQLAEIHL